MNLDGELEEIIKDAIKEVIASTIRIFYITQISPQKLILIDFLRTVILF